MALKIGSIQTTSNKDYSIVDVEITDDKGNHEGFAQIKIKPGHDIEKKFENMVRMVIKESKK